LWRIHHNLADRPLRIPAVAEQDGALPLGKGAHSLPHHRRRQFQLILIPGAQTVAQWHTQVADFPLHPDRHAQNERHEAVSLQEVTAVVPGMVKEGLVFGEVRAVFRLQGVVQDEEDRETAIFLCDTGECKLHRDPRQLLQRDGGRREEIVVGIQAPGADQPQEPVIQETDGLDALEGEDAQKQQEAFLSGGSCQANKIG